MKKLDNILESIAKPLLPITPWLLRLGLGTSFILHGIGKFPLPPERMVRWFESMGYNFPEFITSAVAIGEVLAGAGIILGGLISGHIGNLISRISGGAVVVIMIGALWIAHSQWFTDFLTPFTECADCEKPKPGYKHFIYSEHMYLLILGTYFAIKGNK